MRLLVALLLVAATSAQEARRPMTVDDALDLKSVGNALISPDGRSLYYSRDVTPGPKLVNTMSAFLTSS